MATPNEEILRKMSYSELKKCAKDRGIKGSKKADNLISAILAQESADDSFVKMERKIMNSSKKNKIEKFAADKATPGDTPRRETYTVDTPSTINAEKVAKFAADKATPSDNPRRETYDLDTPSVSSAAKIAKFAADKATPGDNSRRETYDVDLASISITNFNDDLMLSSASPQLKKSIAKNDSSLNVTQTRGSERKSQKKRKVSFLTPLRRSSRKSEVTPGYFSVKDRPKTPIPSRSSTARKGNASSIVEESVLAQLPDTPTELNKRSLTARKSNDKLVKKGKRPSTPMPQLKLTKMKLSGASYLGTPIASSATGKVLKQSETEQYKSGEKGKRTSTPMPQVKLAKMNANDLILLEKTIASPFVAEETSEESETKELEEKKSSVTPQVAKPVASRSRSQTPAFKATPVPRPRIQTPGFKATPVPKVATKRGRSPSPTASSSKVKRTPNFNKLHEKQFEKMESIDEYQKRKAANSAKKLKEHLKFHDPAKPEMSKKLAVKKQVSQKKFGGIPFIPSVTSTKNMKTNFATAGVKPSFAPVRNKPRNAKSKVKANASKLAANGTANSTKSSLSENTPLKRRFKFDLQASLSKKLTYKPHKGPLKPLVDTNLNNTVLSAAPTVIAKNAIVVAKRAEARDVLRGVRKNKRFDLQMKNRKIME